jgi:hypothetical protein
MSNETKIESRISGNAHFADHLRSRLLRRACPAVREVLLHMTNAELVEKYLRHEEQGRAHVAKRRAEKEACE